MGNKIDEFMEKSAAPRALSPEAKAKYQEARGRRGKELELWHRWNNSGRKEEDLAPLMRSLEPLVRSETQKRLSGLGGSIPQSALHAELRIAALQGVKSYDPQRGMQLSSHIVGNFRRANDFIAANRNEKYMPKEDVESYQAYQNAKNEFIEEHGREPSAAELQSKLPGWQTKKIKKMQRGFGAEVYTDMGTEIEGPTGPSLNVHSAYQLMKSVMPPDERTFAELHYPDPESGTPQMSVSSIAKKMGKTLNQTYRIKTRVEQRLGQVLKNE